MTLGPSNAHAAVPEKATCAYPDWPAPPTTTPTTPPLAVVGASVTHNAGPPVTLVFRRMTRWFNVVPLVNGAFLYCVITAPAEKMFPLVSTLKFSVTLAPETERPLISLPPAVLVKVAGMPLWLLTSNASPFPESWIETRGALPALAPLKLWLLPENAF